LLKLLLERRLTVVAGVTAEEITAKRRAERKQFKLDRARAIAEAAREAEAVFAERGVVPSETSVVIPSAATWKPSLPAQESTSTAETACVAPAENNVRVGLGDATDAPDAEDLEDREHLQLTLQEAFFLMWSLDCLSVLNPSTVGTISILTIDLDALI
jgi:tRNA-splicing endonuclease subunit Sen2